jgi:hypothetical protein
MFDHRHKFEIKHLYQGEPRARIAELDCERLPHGKAALYLIELHADADATLPVANASEEEQLAYAQRFGISDIRVTKLVREHKPGTSPGHYQQP